MDRFESMSIAVAAAEAGTLTGAAKRLDMPLTTVSRKVAELEAHLGMRLFRRASRRLSPTEAGAGYLAACRRILEQMADAERAASGEYAEPRGEITVTAPIVFGRLHLVPTIVEFLATHPAIDVRLVLTDRIVHLIDDHIDVALRIGDLPDTRLVATRIGEIRHVVCASPAYIARRGWPKSPQDLAAHDCVTFDTLGSPTAWSFPGERQERRVAVRSRLTVNTAEAAIDAAMAGLGLTRVLSYQVADAVRAGSLRIVLPEFEPSPTPIHLVHTGQSPLPLKTRAFLDFSTPRLRARAA